MCFVSSGVTAIITNGIPVTFISAIDEVEANFVFASEILVEKLFHARLAIHCLVFTGTAIVAFFVAGALDFRNYEKLVALSVLNYSGVRYSNIIQRITPIYLYFFLNQIFGPIRMMKFYLVSNL